MIPSIHTCRCKLHVILRSILILECDFRFNFNLKFYQCNRNDQLLHLTTKMGWGARRSYAMIIRSHDVIICSQKLSATHVL